jgi:hypothetical protein
LGASDLACKVRRIKDLRQSTAQACVGAGATDKASLVLTAPSAATRGLGALYFGRPNVASLVLWTADLLVTPVDSARGFGH